MSKRRSPGHAKASPSRQPCLRWVKTPEGKWTQVAPPKPRRVTDAELAAALGPASADLLALVSKALSV